jgi:diguanylate cyclase (GGDEF)-like protein
LKREEELSSHDFLTGAVNSRYFFELAQREIRRMSREKRAFTLAYIDVDDFKTVNDSGGHRAGDILLRSIAVTIKRSVREIDIVGRLGGDEFAVLMPLTAHEGAQLTISRMRKKLEEAMSQQRFGVTFSIGAVTFLHPPATVDEVVGLADNQMYEVKRSGKNSTKHIVFDKELSE